MLLAGWLLHGLHFVAMGCILLIVSIDSCTNPVRERGRTFLEGRNTGHGNTPSIPPKTDPMCMRLLYGRKQAAQQLSLSVRTIDYAISDGSLRCKRRGGRVLIPHAELLRYAEALPDAT